MQIMLVGWYINSITTNHKNLRSFHLSRVDTYIRKLYYTPFFDKADWYFGLGQEAFINHNCPVKNCYITSNRSYFPHYHQFDSILFHVRDMSQNINDYPKQKMRKPNQIYVMFSMESPLNADFPYQKFNSFFNWTMTYRKDSDVLSPYGWTVPLSNPHQAPPSEHFNPSMELVTNNIVEFQKYVYMVQAKKKQVAWIVSNCGTHSQREKYVKKLQFFKWTG